MLKKTYPEPWNSSSFYQFHAQKVPKICNIDIWIENDTPPLWHFSKDSFDLVAGSFPYFHILWSYNLVPAKNTHSDIRVPVNLFNFSCIVSKYSLLNSSLEILRKHQQTSSWKTSVAKVLNKYALYLIPKQDHLRWMKHRLSNNHVMSLDLFISMVIKINVQKLVMTYPGVSICSENLIFSCPTFWPD